MKQDLKDLQKHLRSLPNMDVNRIKKVLKILFKYFMALRIE